MGTRQHETRDRRSAGLQKPGELAAQVVCSLWRARGPADTSALYSRPQNRVRMVSIICSHPVW